jgi:carboxylesterase type B
VRDNITAFGGDEDNVTIFGESAGAMSVGTLLGVPAAHGLFHKAILQSGAATSVGDTESATDVARRLLDAAGLNGSGETNEATADALVALPLDQLLAAQAKVIDSMAGEVGRLPWRPVVDGVVLPEPPLAQVAAGAAADIPVLIGTNLEEWRLFAMLDQATDLDEARLERRIAKIFPDDADRTAEIISCYRERLGAAAKPLDVWVAAASDQVFRIPAIRLAERQAEHRSDTRMYLFTYHTPAFGGALGSCHALEIPFVFETLDAGGAGMLVGPVVDRHRQLATTMADAWVAFARTGEPISGGMPEWPAYDKKRRATMRFDVDTCEVLDDPMGAERELWENRAS